MKVTTCSYQESTFYDMNHARDMPYAGEGRAISREECATYRGCGENTSC